MQQNVVSFLKRRGFVDNMTSDDLEQCVTSPCRVYVGFDPTADSLHLGNLVGIIALNWMQRFGHLPFGLVGGATGKIGDPSGKNRERPLLSPEKLHHNVEKIEKQLGSYFEGLTIVNNSDWLSTYNLIDFLRDVGKYFRIGSMVTKESVRNRMQSDEGMSYTEFSYQILQSYDFYYLAEKRGVILQIGGNDQWGNITASVTFARKLSKRTLYGFTHPLLTRKDGIKFGKSEKGPIWLDPEKTSPYQCYQYLFGVSDVDVMQMLRMLTFIDSEEIFELEVALKKGSCVPNTAQTRLAEEVIRYVHGERALNIAKKVTAVLAPGSRASLDREVLEEVEKDMPHVFLPFLKVMKQKYCDVALSSGLVASKSEAVRLIKNGGAYLNNEKIDDPSFHITSNYVIGGKYMLLGSGKKKKVLVKLDV